MASLFRAIWDSSLPDEFIDRHLDRIGDHDTAEPFSCTLSYAIRVSPHAQRYAIRNRHTGRYTIRNSRFMGCIGDRPVGFSLSRSGFWKCLFRINHSLMRNY